MTSDAATVSGPTTRAEPGTAPCTADEPAGRPVRTDGSSVWVGPLVLWAALLPVLLLLRPYRGPVQDALIYVGRGLADRDPGGVGTDMIFADDRQTGFSVLRPAIHALLDHLPAAQTSMLLVAAGLLLWLLAAVAVARSLAQGATAAAAVVCALALPADYGGSGVFAYAEAIATPRVFAEAAVLSGLAALTAGRRTLGLALLALSVALHPLMALPGLGIAAVLLASEDPRWLAPIGVAVLAGLLAAWMQLPLAGRLFETFDPAWLAILAERCPNLFPNRWSPDTFGPVACQAASAVLAGSMSPPRVRRLMFVAVAVAVAGVAVSFASAATRPSVLITQLQIWRALWPLAVLGDAGAAVAAVGLWRRGRPGRLALALLASSWACRDAPAMAAALGFAAVGVHGADRRGLLPRVSARLVAASAVAAAALALASLCGSAAGLLALVGAPGAPAGPALWPYVLASGAATIPCAAAAIAWALRRPRASSRAGRAAAGLGFAALGAAGLALWDGRDGERRLLDERPDVGALRAAIGPGAGEVLWMGDRGEAWWLAGRPSYFDATQGSPIVFSRELALRWAERARRLRGLALVAARDVAPWGETDRDAAPAAPTPAAVRAVCAGADRPAAIVAPGAGGSGAPAGWPWQVWRPAFPLVDLVLDDAGARWRAVDAFTVIPCRAEP